ncbi:MAG TPA: M67 family metallopeptidase [Tepidisphaeraceae bacterium]|jgi:proteasome lid subunit RPN8/RPN11
MQPLTISKLLYHQIESEGSTIFPNECCGVIYGHDEPNRRVVTRLEAVNNEFEEAEKYHRFSITPKDLIAAEKSAAEHGELVLGFYHSHPDHPARPSEYDRVHAWPFYSYVIVSIMKGKPADMTCWVLDEATEQFMQQPIQLA